MRLRLAAALVAALSAGAASAQQSGAPIPCGTLYTIQRGDTLHRIAVRAYGPEATYRTLWRHNRARLGRGDPSQIEVGQVIEVPCLAADGSPLPVDHPAFTATPASAAGEPGAAAASETAPTTSAAQVAEGAAPVAEGAAPDGAASRTEQAAAAATDAAAPATASAAPSPTVVDVTGAPAIVARLAVAALQLELPPGSFRLAPDGGAPGAVRVGLMQPDCRASALSDRSRQACDGLAWSDPIVEAVAIWHGRKALPEVATPADLAGLRLCRAEGAPEAVVEAAGLRATRVEPQAADCLRAVADAQADVALSPAAEADAAMADPMLRSALRELVALTTVYDLRAAGPADDPAAVRAVDAMNAGLRRLRDSGTWFAAVDSALAGEAFGVR